MDHNKRRLNPSERSLEVHFDEFVLSQTKKPNRNSARNLALSTSYGAEAYSVSVADNEGRAYALGPLPAEDDIDPRAPAVVVWYQGEMFCLLASYSLEAEVLLTIAESCYC